MTHQSSSDITRQKLIEAATEVFSEVGYKSATVREIVRRASVNQAAINYHFRGKDALYCEVMRRAFQQMQANSNHEEGKIGPEQQLRDFMQSMMAPMLETATDNPGYARLLAWEMIEPSGYLDSLEKEGPVQHHRQVMDIMRQFLPQGAPEHQVAWAAFWLLGQCSVIRQAQSMLKQMPPDLAQSLKDNSAELPQFFAQLALGGLNNAFKPKVN